MNGAVVSPLNSLGKNRYYNKKSKANLKHLYDNNEIGASSNDKRRQWEFFKD